MNWITTGWRNENYNLQNVDYEFNNHSHYKHVKWSDFKIAQRKISCAKKHSEALPPKQILIFDEKYCQKSIVWKNWPFRIKYSKNIEYILQKGRVGSNEHGKTQNASHAAPKKIQKNVQIKKRTKGNNVHSKACNMIDTLLDQK